MKLRGYLTRRANGLYLLTYGPPAIAPVGRTAHLDAYPAPGDALGFNNLCPWSVKLLWGIEDLPHLESVRVWVQGGTENT